MLQLIENKILVCIDARQDSNVLLRMADKKAKELNCEWMVLYIETPQHYTIDNNSQRKILQFLAIAKDMGAQIHHVESEDVLSGIMFFINDLQERNQIISHLIVGQDNNDAFFSKFRRSLSEKLTKKLRKFPIEIEIIPLINSNSVGMMEKLQLKEVKARGIIFALLISLVASLISEIAQRMLFIDWQVKIGIVIALFLVSSIFTSLLHGFFPALLVSILGFLLIDYLYILPIYSFDILDPSDSVNMSIFLVLSVILSFMGAFNRGYSSFLLRKKHRLQELYEIYRLASEAKDKGQAIKVLHQELTKFLEVEMAFFLPDKNSGEIKLVYPSEIEILLQDENILIECWKKSCATGLGTSISFDSAWRFEPLATARGEIGVVGIKLAQSSKISTSFGLFLKALSEQAAAILERIDLTVKMHESQMREEREKLRSMLLSSVSHDLKTPLASIIGSLSVYKRMQNMKRLEPEDASDLTDTALEEAQRLNSFISNILDMTRIESGDIEFNKEWSSPLVPIEQVRSNSRYRLSTRKFMVIEPEFEIEVEMDVEMTKQVLQNIVDNAIKYSPPESPITIVCELCDGGFVYKIIDCGLGIAQDKLEAIFDKYERLTQTDSKIAGTGLGLSICRAIMTEQGGSIIAKNHPEGGAEFIVWFTNFKKV